MREEKLIIKCPYCGAEYIPSELYYPEDFLPNVKDMVKDENENIIAYTGNIMNLVEEYTCDKCGHTFKVIAEIKFKTEKCPQHDFDFEHEVKVYDRERTELSED